MWGKKDESPREAASVFHRSGEARFLLFFSFCRNHACISAPVLLRAWGAALWGRGAGAVAGTCSCCPMAQQGPAPPARSQRGVACRGRADPAYPRSSPLEREPAGCVQPGSGGHLGVSGARRQQALLHRPGKLLQGGWI